MPSIYPENLRSPFCSPFFDDILLITVRFQIRQLSAQMGEPVSLNAIPCP